MEKQWILSLAALSGFCLASQALALTEMTDSEMSEVSGQASLIEIDKYDHAGNNFYQVKFNAEVQASVNIDNLKLSDSAGNPQIDIDNFSINGGDETGVSSATIINPFVEFAYSGSIDDTDAKNRELIGVRIGAESFDGYLSFGNRGAVSASDNHSSVNGGGAIAANSGINMFHGYMKTSPVKGKFTTLSSKTVGGERVVSFTTPSTSDDSNGRVGDPDPYVLSGVACVENPFSPGNCTFITNVPFTVNNARMFYKSLIVDGNPDNNTEDGPATLLKDGFTINTTSGPVSSATIVTDEIPAPDLDGAHVVGTASAYSIPFGMDATANLIDLKVKATINQDLSYIHRARIQPDSLGGVGGFSLSAQNRDLIWRGSPTTPLLDENGNPTLDGNGDTVTVPVAARAGWWMAVADPVDLGELSATVDLPEAALQNVAAQATDYLQDTDNPNVPVPVAIGLVFKPHVGDVPVANTIPVPLGSQDLGAAQNEIRNCFNGVLGC